MLESYITLGSRQHSNSFVLSAVSWIMGELMLAVTKRSFTKPKRFESRVHFR